MRNRILSPVPFYFGKKTMTDLFEQAYDIITLLSDQTEKISLAEFKYKPNSFDMKMLAI